MGVYDYFLSKTTAETWVSISADQDTSLDLRFRRNSTGCAPGAAQWTDFEE